MSQPSKPPGPPRNKGGAPEPADDLSIPVLTERVSVPPKTVRAVPAFNLDIELPSLGAAVPPAPTAVPVPAAAPPPEAATPAPSVAPAATAPIPTFVAPPSTLSPSGPATRTPVVDGGEPPPRARPPITERIDRPDPPPPAPWGRIEIELREAILNDLAQRLPQEVEAIVRRHMTGAINTMIERLSSDTRVAVAASLREIVDHAVKAELERLRAKKR